MTNVPNRPNSIIVHDTVPLCSIYIPLDGTLCCREPYAYDPASHAMQQLIKSLNETGQCNPVGLVELKPHEQHITGCKYKLIGELQGGVRRVIAMRHLGRGMIKAVVVK